MTRARRPPCLSLGLPMLLAVLLGGCLEVEQYPAYAHGAYAGKKDDQAPLRKFGNDRRAWQAAVAARTGFQNEYLRTKP
ncbi:hypothetical protein [Massilia sp. TSP1-1-2]|uniref:hypothetical protein n=1 Tax=unclassified Massilia TaxID=2609279 RepID=UPI003CEE24F2